MRGRHVRYGSWTGSRGRTPRGKVPEKWARRLNKYAQIEAKRLDYLHL